jgi:hypothetical protein
MSECVWTIGAKMLTRETWSRPTWEKTCSSASFSTTNSMWPCFRCFRDVISHALWVFVVFNCVLHPSGITYTIHGVGCGLGGLGFESRRWQIIFFFFRNFHTRSGAHSASGGNQFSFTGIKRPGREVEHSCPSIADIMNERSYGTNPKYTCMT